ncbi:hypothetical protein LCGC14_1998450, partial [marine sediment metagenome]
ATQAGAVGLTGGIMTGALQMSGADITLLRDDRVLAGSYLCIQEFTGGYGLIGVNVYEDGVGNYKSISTSWSGNARALKFAGGSDPQLLEFSGITSVDQTITPDATLTLVHTGNLGTVGVAQVGVDESITGAWAFTQIVVGVTPTLDAHLATKWYVDDALSGVGGHTTLDADYGAETITSLFTFSRGAAVPFAVTSASALNVPNLDADKVDGQHASAFATSSHAHAIDDLSDVVITAVGSGEVLGYSGGWINRTLVEAGIAAASHAHAAADVTSGSFAVVRGGTGLASLTSGSYLRGTGTAAVTMRTPAQVLADIGAAATSHNHAATDITSGILAVAQGGTGVSGDTYDADKVDGKHETAFLLADGTRAFSGTIDAGGQLIDNAPFLRGYIDGLTTQLDVDTDHDVQVNPGACADSLASNDRIIQVTVAFTKRIDAAWAAGDTNGGMATGSVAADTEYNLIIIEKDSDGAIDMMFDVSAIGANKPAGYTARRRIGSVFTDGSANILAYQQVHDWFYYEAQVVDLNDTTGTIGVYETATLSVPPGQVAFIVGVVLITSGTRVGLSVRHPAWAGTQTQVFIRDDADSTVRQFQSPFLQPVDENSQIEYTISFGGTWSNVGINTLGWLDDRGKNE